MSDAFQTALITAVSTAAITGGVVHALVRVGIGAWLRGEESFKDAVLEDLEHIREELRANAVADGVREERFAGLSREILRINSRIDGLEIAVDDSIHKVALDQAKDHDRLGKLDDRVHELEFEANRRKNEGK